MRYGNFLGEECLSHRVEGLFGAERLGPSLGDGWVRSTFLLRSSAVGVKGQIVLIEQCLESICCGVRTEEGSRPGRRLRGRAR